MSGPASYWPRRSLTNKHPVLTSVCCCTFTRRPHVISSFLFSPIVEEHAERFFPYRGHRSNRSCRPFPISEINSARRLNVLRFFKIQTFNLRFFPWFEEINYFENLFRGCRLPGFLEIVILDIFFFLNDNAEIAELLKFLFLMIYRRGINYGNLFFFEGVEWTLLESVTCNILFYNELHRRIN